MERLADFRIKLGDNIQEAREARNITQEELGGKLGVARETVRNWERGERGVRADQLYEMALELKVPSDFILGLTKSKETKESIWAASDALGLSDDAIKALQGINFDDGFDDTDNMNIVSRFIASEYFPSLVESIVTVIKAATKLRDHADMNTLPKEIRETKHALYDSSDVFRKVLNDISLSELGHKVTVDKAIDEAEAKFREYRSNLPDGERQQLDSLKGR